MFIYVCKDCCEEHELNFSPLAVNEAGRKNCYICGSNMESRLAIKDEEEIKDETNVS
jgi:hypothetical protein